MTGEKIAMIAVIGVGALVFGALAVGLVLVIRDTVRREGNWGINFGGQTACCPRCEEPLPMVRKPNSWRQALWGGWTCTECGCEIDKWGKEIIADALPVKDMDVDETAP